jgi:uncharacterized radical SAM superfamily protein
MLPWETYYNALARIKGETPLFLSAHVGFPDRETCGRLKEAGLDQALIDVIGDDETARHIYHLGGLGRVVSALDAVAENDLPLIPHVVAGLNHGRIRGEVRALETIRRYGPSALVIVALTPLKGTPMDHASPPSPYEVARLMAKARLMMPAVPIAMGCERPRNRAGILMERLAILAGANRVAVWSDEAIEDSLALGLKPRFQATCCSVDFNADLMIQPLR